MKMTKKKVVVIALAVCALAILSMGTLAWFNATAEVTNKFAVSGENNTPGFSIEVTEAELDANGDPTSNRTETGNTYEKVAPGDVLSKDPIVKNTGDYDQWVRVNVLISKAFADKVAVEQKVSVDAINMEKLFGGFDYTLYPSMEFCDELTDYYIYTYYYKDVLAPDEQIEVFDNLIIPDRFTQEDMTYLTFEVKVKAEAVQADNLGTTALEAFQKAQWEVNTAYDYKI